MLRNARRAGMKVMKCNPHSAEGGAAWPISIYLYLRLTSTPEGPKLIKRPICLFNESKFINYHLQLQGFSDIL